MCVCVCVWVGGGGRVGEKGRAKRREGRMRGVKTAKMRVGETLDNTAKLDDQI